jgi:hypothetical protein
MFTRTDSGQVALVDALDEFGKSYKTYIAKRKSIGAYIKQFSEAGVDVTGLLGMYIKLPGPLLSMAMPMLQSDASREAVKVRKAITRVERAAAPYIERFEANMRDGFDFQDAISAAEVDPTMQIKIENFPAQVEEFEELENKPVVDSKVVAMVRQFATMKRNPREANVDNPDANKTGERRDRTSLSGADA